MLKNKNFLNANLLSFVLPSLWFLIIMLLSGSPYHTFMNLQWIPFVGMALALLTVLPNIGNKLNTATWFLILLCVMIVITMSIYFEFSRVFYWRFLCELIITYSLVKYYGFSKMIDLFRKLMVAIAAISIVGYVLVNNTSLLNWLPQITNINGKAYGIGIIFNYITSIPERNCGIFWEPGIFATYLIFALVFEVLDPSPKYRFLKIVICVIALITANSTAGFLLGVIVVLLFLLSKINSKKIGPMAAFFSVIFLVATLIALINLDAIISQTALANNQYIAKLLSENLQESARITVIEHNLEIFTQSPVFGAGVTTVGQNIITAADISTPTYVLSIFGVLGALLPIGFFVGVFRQNNLNIFQKIVIFTIIFMIISKEPHLEFMFTWIIFFALLNDDNALGKKVIQNVE